MEKFDVLIIGGGPAGLSCALILGSAKPNDFAHNKKIGILTHQRASHLQDAILNNVLGLNANTAGKDILIKGQEQLDELYPHVQQITKEKALSIAKKEGSYHIQTNKSIYKSKLVVIAVGYTKNLFIEGLEAYVIPHPKTKPTKERICLLNEDQKVDEGLYVAGTLAGGRSQYAIACGSGAAVATDILTLWNGGVHTKVHDKLAKS